jgi:enamine deaminase RidA (YjgF/YER057c/UK114 family)
MSTMTRETIRSRLAELGLALPPAPKPAGSYVDVARAGNLLFLSGKAPRQSDGRLAKGRVGADVLVADACAHARSVGVALLSALYTELTDLERVRRVVKVLGFVNATPDFHELPAVIDGCSNLFIEIFGERGRHARSAIGVASLPFGITVEIEAIFEIDDGAGRGS